MTQIQQITRRREAIALELLSIRSLYRGSITEQYLESGGDSGEPVRRTGPYYVLSRREEGRTRSRRLRPGPELERARRDVEAHAHFAGLCRELESLTERLGELERSDPEAKKKEPR